MTREVEILTSLKDRFEDVVEEGLLGADTEAVDALDSNKEIVEALEMSIKALEQEPKTEWIPVGERLPEEMIDCLITVKWKDGVCTTEKLKLFDKTYWHGFGRDINVIAWQPLPKPYKAESEE